MLCTCIVPKTPALFLVVPAAVEGWVIFVTKIHEEAQEDDIHEAFAEFGDIKNIYLNLDRRTGYVKGYALVEYASKEEAEAAISEMNGTEVLTQAVSVTWAFSEGPSKKGGPRERGARGRR
jgi:RNA-binding protein 8A